MADKRNKNPRMGDGDESSEPDLEATGRSEAATPEANAEGTSPDEAADGVGSIEDMFAAEDADIETSLTDADLSFLDTEASDLAAERLADLQRLQAEYVNYRNRVERDREANKVLVIADIAKSLLPILDDLDRAEAHGDLVDGPLLLIAQKMRGTVERMGVTRVGAKDETFDHNVHEAIVQVPTPDIDSMKIAEVIEIGYQLGSRLLRPAKVVVAVPQQD